MSISGMKSELKSWQTIVETERRENEERVDIYEGRIAELEHQLAEARATIARLSAPVSDEEYKFLKDGGSGQIEFFNKAIAARAEVKG